MLLKIRGELMQDAFKENMSGMCAIIGFDCTKVEKIITDNKLKVEVANDLVILFPIFLPKIPKIQKLYIII